MTRKIECDRCKTLAAVDSLDGREFRMVQVQRGAAASSTGGSSVITSDFELCPNCISALDKWIKDNPVKVRHDA